MGKKAFTLIEIIAVVVIAGILATLGLPAYQNMLESSKADVCATNLETLQKAVDIYITEHDTVPGSLAELEPRQIEKAYAQVMQGKGAWKKKLAAWIVKASQPINIAYAQITGGTYGLPQLHCPCDRSGSVSSYEINKNEVASKSVANYGRLKKTDPTMTLIGETLGTGIVGSWAFVADGYDSGKYTTLKARGHKIFGVAGTTRTCYLIGISVTGQLGMTIADSWGDAADFFFAEGRLNPELYKTITGKSGSTK